MHVRGFFMLRQTFIHARGVGPTTEQRLWKWGVRSWEEFLDKISSGGLPNRRLLGIAPTVRESEKALAAGRIEFFSEALPSCEQWRLYSDFVARAAFVDIETTGLMPAFDKITVIGLFDGDRFQAFVRGRNLDRFPGVAAQYDLLVTYNGATFDLPFLRSEFPRLHVRAHLDLRYPLRRLGYSGGLKEVEREVGIRRPAGLRDLDGFDAVRLWHEYKRGRPNALETLLEYTRLDVENLLPLANRVSCEMPRQIGAAPRVDPDGRAGVP
jgi:uncharacterized protein YprB with RNaseH-like and TPR domain